MLRFPLPRPFRNFSFFLFCEATHILACLLRGGILRCTEGFFSHASIILPRPLYHGGCTVSNTSSIFYLFGLYTRERMWLDWQERMLFMLAT